MTTTDTRPSAARAPAASRAARFLAGLIVLAAAIRFATLGVQSLDADEGFTWEIARKPLGDALAQIPHTESTPPLYYVLVWAWTKLFGTSEYALRALSALAGTLAVPVAYAIGARLRSARAGLLAAAFVAVSPLLVWYSQEARSYILFMLLAALSFWAFLRALDGERRWAAWWALASAAAIATHYYAAVTVVPEAIWLLLRAPRRRDAGLAVGAVAVAGMALAPLALYQSDHVSRPWADALSVKDELLATSQSFLVGIQWTWLIHRPGVIVLGLLFAALIAMALRVPAARLPLGVAAFATVVPFAISIAGSKYFTPGNELGVWPLLAVVAAIGATTRRAGMVLAAAACAVMLATTLAAPFDDSLQREDWRELVGTLNDVPGPRAVGILTAFQDTRVVRYYLRRQAPPAPAPEIAVIGRPPGPAAGYFVPPVPGMQQVGVTSRGKLAYARFRAQAPTRFPDAQLFQR